ncbi:P-loop NTPase fold protein [Streptomyces sp. NPDC058439]|uniref:P-loop NTPase fold protein n=1 Tax=Streptomyces sp. NPDC058439 TaxID=3346500 RepID=UPI00366A4699
MARQHPWTIEDIAIDRRDQDLFDHQSVAQQLARTVTSTGQSLAIGLLGPFGSGKSSVVRLLTTELAVNKNWAVLHVSAEHHSGVARARALMYALLDAARQQGVIDEDAYLSERACLEGSRQHTLPRPDPLSGLPGRSGTLRYLRAAVTGLMWVTAMLGTLWLIGMCAVFLAHRMGIGEGVSVPAWFASKGATSLTTVLVSGAAISAVLAAGKEGALQTLKAYDITVTSPRPDSTDELEQAFTRLLRRIDRRLLIAVDDIDRLAATDVLEALTTIRSFLLTGHQHPRQPVFILSCDESIVREAIIGVRPGLAHRPASAPADTAGLPADPESSGQTEPKARATAARKATEEAAQEYLNKLFTVRLTLPAPDEADLRDYAAELLLHGKHPHPVVAELGGEAEVRTLLDVLIHHDVHDPRHVIRLLNSFFTDYQLAQRREQPVGNRPPRIAAGEVTGYPIALARLTVLRHDFRSLYDAISGEEALLNLLDDVLLGIRQDFSDPLLHSYLAHDAHRLDLNRHPGLRYLLATATRARVKRPHHIGPLISLGSSQASRLLGSDMATEIQQELIGRDGAAFAERLTAPDLRARVLEAAAAAISAARPGQDLDNALTAAISALGDISSLFAEVPQEEHRALRILTDTIARQRPQMTLPPPSHTLVPLLGLTDPAHLPSLITTLQAQPDSPAEARTWASTLLQIPAGPPPALTAAVDTYFTNLTGLDGSEQDLAFWTSHDQRPHQAAWPASAFAAVLTMATHTDDPQTVSAAGTAAIEHPGIHHWNGPMAQALLTCLHATARPASREAIRVLTHSNGPDDAWGDTSHSDEYSTLAGQLTAAVADACTEDDDVDSVLTTLGLLTTWLPGIKGLAESDKATHAIAHAAAAVAADHPRLAHAAGEVLHELPESAAAACASTLADALVAHREPTDVIGIALRDSLIDYLHRVPNSSAQPTHDAVAACVTGLTADLAALNPAGSFARTTLPMLLTTPAGHNQASDLAATLISSIPTNAPAAAEELLLSLHVVFSDDSALVAQLPYAVQYLQQLIAHGHPLPALTFMARYVDHSAVDANWMHWYAQHWTTLNTDTQDRVCAAAGRVDLPAELRNCLIQHLLHTHAVEPWQHAASLWPAANSDQQGSLLAAASGRAPELADCVTTSDADLLCAALIKAQDQLGDVLHLMADATEANPAIAAFIRSRLTDPQWTPERCDAAIAASTAPDGLWRLVVPLMTEDQTAAQHGAQLIDSLITRHPASIPGDLVKVLTPPLREADESLATAIGHALRGHHKIAKKLRDAMNGHSHAPHQRRRNTAFMEACGLR